jgi:hypothetical protein
MSRNKLIGTSALVLMMSCAKGGAPGVGNGPDGGNGSGGDAPTTCGELCDQDGDGVLDPSDDCPDTPQGAVVNHVGCADSQLTATLEPTFPSYGLTWTSAGDLGRAGGLTWTYTGIQRADLFHIDWTVCDDPGTPCGVSLDGPLDASENWQFSAAESNLPGGKLVFTNATHIALADATSPALTGRLTITMVDGSSVPVPFATMAALGVTARTATYGAEIMGTAFTVVALIEVEDNAAGPWTPYLDYYDAAPTPETGGISAVSFGGSFYDK